uniref:Cilia and flagella associated protein 107 n=1 Tax=Salvator merianae TaxID=96440 RepID=A0A8D0BIA6_SALMN
MFTRGSDVQEWNLPSWRIQPKYSTKVLIGNWVEERRKGLPRKFVLTHHEEPNHHHLVSQYDDQYNRHGCNPILPPLRKWNGHKMVWMPEKSDYPITEPPTNYGLFEHLAKKWSPREPGVLNSVYMVSYTKPPASSYDVCQRAVTPHIFGASCGRWLPRSLNACV